MSTHRELDLKSLQFPDHAPGSDSAPMGETQWIETHISWVALTGPYAYKIKKPVDFGFLDFSTPEKRHAACLEELRLNRRTASDLYLDVLPIVGPRESPKIVGDSDGNDGAEPIDWALRMRQFPVDATLDQVLKREELRPEHIEQLARTVGEFHQTIAIVVAADERFGDLDLVEQPALDNFPPILDWAQSQDEATQSRLAHLKTWTEQEFAAKRRILAERKRSGRVRDCHGDLHLANLVLLDGQVRMFDCLEFNDELRKIDVIADLAFLVMDLEERGRPDFAAIALNAWLEQTGDYEGLTLLRFFVVYRAMVRVKVAVLRLAQTTDESHANRSETQSQLRRLNACLDLADRWSKPPSKPTLVMTHGVSGSGKSFGSQCLLEHWAPKAIRVRSDLERKRLFSTSEADLYDPEITKQVYHRLAEIAEIALQAGFFAIVDAAFLKRWQRGELRALADRRQVSLRAISFQADESTLRERIVKRMQAGQDPSDAGLDVLDGQLKSREAIGNDERLDVIVADLAATDNLGWLKSL